MCIPRPVTLLLCMLAAGCASVDGTTDKGPEPALSPSNDGGSGDAAIEPATGDGRILVTTSGDQLRIVAAFRSQVPSRNLPPLGDEKCHVFEPGDGSAIYAGDATAGKITVRAGSRELSLKLAGDGKFQSYESPFSSLEGILPGDPIEVEATGGTVPAFRVSVALAHPLQVLTPLADGIAKDAAFDISWQPTSAGALVAIQLAGTGKSLSCVTAAADGALVIPEEHVRAVAADPATTDDGKPALRLGASIFTTSNVRVGAFDISAQSVRSPGQAMLVLH